MLLREHLVRGQQRESWVRGEKCGNDVLVFGAKKAARRVHEPAAGFEQRRGGGEDRALFGAELGDIALVLAPLEVGIAAQRAEAAARRVDEHAVNLAGE